jgi:hypothetical protein
MRRSVFPFRPKSKQTRFLTVFLLSKPGRVPFQVLVFIMAASSDFNLLALPFEIRKSIYQSMLEGQVVHCCPDETHEHHNRSIAEDTRKDHFFDDFMHCSSKSYESLSYEVRWTSVVPSDRHNYLPSPSHILNFLLSCKTVWNEMEPLIWKYMTFCIGLHQFAGFCIRFLLQERTSHPITSPRAQLLQRVSLALVERVALANSIGNGDDARFENVSSFAVVESARKSSIGYLTDECTGLQHLTALVNAPDWLESYTTGVPALAFDDSLTILHFKGLKSFKLMVHGPLDLHDSEITYQTAPPTHRIKLALDASQMAMAEIVARSTEPPSDVPPAGISLTDPDYLWLKEMYEQDGGGHPRLGELILRTKLHLKERGIEMPPVSEINF